MTLRDVAVALLAATITWLSTGFHAIPTAAKAAWDLAAAATHVRPAK